MGVVQLRQIRSYLESNIVPLIDLADYAGKPGADRRNAALARSLAAFAIGNAADIPMDVAAANVTDGYDDGGLDAVYYSIEDRTLYLCQSKWSNDGSGSINLGDTEKFIRGVKDILSLRLALLWQFKGTF